MKEMLSIFVMTFKEFVTWILNRLMTERALIRVRLHIREMVYRFPLIVSPIIGVRERVVEYPFVLKRVKKNFQEGSIIADVGCCDSLFSYKLAKHGFQVCAIDLEPFRIEKHLRLTPMRADIRYAPFREGVFDAVIAVSTLEHVGFAQPKPEAEDGDFTAMNEMKRILKFKGKMFATAPFAGNYSVVPSFERIYDYKRITKLANGLLREEEKFYFTLQKKRKKTVINTRMIEISKKKAMQVIFSKYPDPIAVILLALSKEGT